MNIKLKKNQPVNLFERPEAAGGSVLVSSNTDHVVRISKTKSGLTNDYVSIAPYGCAVVSGEGWCMAQRDSIINLSGHVGDGGGTGGGSDGGTTPPAGYKDRTPVQDVDVVTLEGTNWIEHHSVLTRSPVLDDGSGVVNVRYNLAVDGEFAGRVSAGTMKVYLGVMGLFNDPSHFALVDKISICGYTQIGGQHTKDFYTVNPAFQRTNNLEFILESWHEGDVRGRVLIEIEFTLPNNDYGLSKLDW